MTSCGAGKASQMKKSSLGCEGQSLWKFRDGFRIHVCSNTQLALRLLCCSPPNRFLRQPGSEHYDPIAQIRKVRPRARASATNLAPGLSSEFKCWPSLSSLTDRCYPLAKWEPGPRQLEWSPRPGVLTVDSSVPSAVSGSLCQLTGHSGRTRKDTSIFITLDFVLLIDVQLGKKHPECFFLQLQEGSS